MLNLTLFPDKPILVDDREILSFIYMNKEDRYLVYEYLSQRSKIYLRETHRLDERISVTYLGPYQLDGARLSFDTNVSLRRCLKRDSDGNPIWYTHPDERNETR